MQATVLFIFPAGLASWDCLSWGGDWLGHLSNYSSCRSWGVVVRLSERWKAGGIMWIKFLWLLLDQSSMDTSTWLWSFHLVLPMEVAETIVPISSNLKSCQISKMGRKTDSITQNCRCNTNLSLHFGYYKMQVGSIITSNYHFMVVANCSCGHKIRLLSALIGEDWSWYYELHSTN
jgi:hypothetical protein